MGLSERLGDWRRLSRYYITGVVNTLFGYGLFAAFVAAGANMYAAQIVAHFMGVVFNYFTFSRFTFGDRTGQKWRFAMSYVVSYLLNLATLWFVSQYVASPYIAGLLAVIFVSALNYFVLERYVFARPAQS